MDQDSTKLMCEDGIYAVNQTGFNLLNQGPIDRLATPNNNLTAVVSGNGYQGSSQCLRGSGGSLTIYNGSTITKQISLASPTSSYHRSYLLFAVVHEDSSDLSLFYTSRSVSTGACEDAYAKHLLVNYSSTTQITLGGGTGIGMAKTLTDINHGGMILFGPQGYRNIQISSSGTIYTPDNNYVGQYVRPSCSIKSSEVGVTGDYLTIGEVDVPVSNAPTILACNTNENATFITSNGWGTIWKDSDLDGTGDLTDAFPSISSQWSDFDNDGYGDNPGGISPDSCPSVPGTSYHDMFGCLDSDYDGYSNSGDAFPQDSTQVNDSDQDGFGDNLSGFQGDDCPSVFGTSSRNNTYGCPDLDYDGWADFQDAFENDSSQWKDSDGDGYGDRIDGFAGDDCVNTPGTSYVDRFGCLDSDVDGVSDKNDAFPDNPSQTDDRDGDGYGDNLSESATQVDYFPSDTTQWNDTDGDGYGDNQNGNLPDRFPNDPTRWSDSDHDGVADEDDEFPDDGTQSADTDGDGYGDDPNGNRADAFPYDPEEWLDTDGDGLGNNADAFPFDPTQTEDRDKDGMGDNPMGIGADKFPDDITQWGDIDGDGYGDNPNGTSPDAFPTDATQWTDIDGDGYGDNPIGRLPDAFPNDSTQWEDLDGDGLGDNLTGNNADPYLFDFDNDGYNDSIDPLPKLASPGDLDNDGVPDEDDLFPDDYREWADFDGDGEGDNADTDDDNDGWTDTDEARQGTDPFSSASQPVDSFEIVIPGTAIGLGAWDIIGIFGGVPLFAWIGFGFATRNARTARYEDMLRSAQSIEDLEQVSHMWEYSLMMRMLGPHQGIRLGRLRADLEYEFAGHRRLTIVHESTDQTELVTKEVPALKTSTPVASTPATKITEDGYEWIDYDDQKYYRLTGSTTDWIKFE